MFRFLIVASAIHMFSI